MGGVNLYDGGSDGVATTTESVRPATTTVTLGEFREADDKVMFSFRWRAIGDVSGIETSSEWIAVDTFCAEVIVRMQIFSDSVDALDAVGLSE